MNGRRDRRKQETRAAFLKAGLEMFHEKGIVATRIEDITDLADVARGGFYNYFESKDDLVYALLIEGIEQLRSLLAAGVNVKYSTRKRIEVVVQVHENFFTTHPEYALLFHQARGLLETKSFDVTLLRKGFKQYLNIVGDSLFPPKALSQMSEEAKLGFARMVAGTIAGYRSYSLATGLTPDYKDVTNILLNGLTIPGEKIESQIDNCQVTEQT